MQVYVKCLWSTPRMSVSVFVRHVLMSFTVTDMFGRVCMATLCMCTGEDITKSDQRDIY